MTDPTSLRVGMVGYAFMGAAHSHAWRTAPRFFDLPLQPELTAIAGRNEDGVRAAAAKMGWESAETDWRRLDRAGRHRPDRHLHPGQHPRRDRDRRA